MPVRVALFASGSGSNVENIFLYFKGHPDIEIVSVYCNNPQAYVLERARRLGLASHVFSRSEWKEGLVQKQLEAEKVDWIVLAGFLWLVPPDLVKAYPDKIINVHPALLPDYGGKGMYGHHVHEAVVANGEKESGITIHLVNEEYDKGAHLCQFRVQLEPGETPDTLAQKIHGLEKNHFPPVIEETIRSVTGK